MSSRTPRLQALLARERASQERRARGGQADMLSQRTLDPMGDAYLQSPPPGVGTYASPPRPTSVTAAGVGRNSALSAPTSPLNIVTDYDWGIDDDEPSKILQDLFPSIASTGPPPNRTNVGPVPVRTSTPVTSPRPAIGDPPPRPTTAGKHPRCPAPRRTATRRRGTTTTTTTTRTSRGGRRSTRARPTATATTTATTTGATAAAGGAGGGDGDESSPGSGRGGRGAARGGRGAARGGRGAARGTREGQAELRRRLEMLQEENRQRTAG